jgi:transcriptional regulator with XRE-family HTH domain
VRDADPSTKTFRHWLELEMKSRGLSSRQLAASSGVDHSTISRLLYGDRSPSLETATRLARAIEAPGSPGIIPPVLDERPGATSGLGRVEETLRADPALSHAQVRRIMEYSKAVRRQRQGGSARQSGRLSHYVEDGRVQEDAHRQRDS